MVFPFLLAATTAGRSPISGLHFSIAGRARRSRLAPCKVIVLRADPGEREGRQPPLLLQTLFRSYSGSSSARSRWPISPQLCNCQMPDRWRKRLTPVCCRGKSRGASRGIERAWRRASRARPPWVTVASVSPAWRAASSVKQATLRFEQLAHAFTLRDDVIGIVAAEARVIRGVTRLHVVRRKPLKDSHAPLAQRGSTTISRPLRMAMALAVCSARPRSLESSRSKRSRARRAPTARPAPCLRG